MFLPQKAITKIFVSLSIKKCSCWDTFCCCFMRAGLTLNSGGAMRRILGVRRCFISPVWLARRAWMAHWNSRHEFVSHSCAESAIFKGKDFVLCAGLMPLKGDRIPSVSEKSHFTSRQTLEINLIIVFCQSRSCKGCLRKFLCEN